MKKIWIMNHYAADTFFDRGGRHYYFAKHLIEKGYSVTIFCASTVHNTDKNIEIKEGLYKMDEVDGIPYVFVKTPSYTGNGMRRVRNMVQFYMNLFPVTKKAVRKTGKPDVILASSVHPLTVAAGIQIAKKRKIPCVCEIRDLWPETIVSLGKLTEKSLIAKGLYKLEKRIYEKSDALIFTMEGGREYIESKRWDIGHGGKIDTKKIYHINNGVDMDMFDENVRKHPSMDKDLNNRELFKLVYTGSIRQVNEVDTLISAMKKVRDCPAIKLFIWGNGDYTDSIRKRIEEENITNVEYKGAVKKREVPGILAKSNVNVLHWKNLDILKYGCSYNKLFEYLAAGKPILSTVNTGYSIFKKADCGVECSDNSVEQIAEGIKKIYKMSEAEQMGRAARELGKQYDFKILTQKLIDIIEDC